MFSTVQLVCYKGLAVCIIVTCVHVSCVRCLSYIAMEGESVRMDCGFQTFVNGGNLLWKAISFDSETELGHIVPGDHFCGTDTIDCAVHDDGSITLRDVTIGDYGDKYYRCLRGDEEGYKYFSDFKLTVLSKESIGYPVIQVPRSTAVVYIIGTKNMIHGYEQPTCKDDEDGDLTVTCCPPSGVAVDKVYDHIHCNCTDSDGNSYSLNITVNSHTDLKESCWTASVLTWLVLGLLLTGLIVPLILCIVYKHCKKKKKAKNSGNKENDDEEKEKESGENNKK